MLLAGCLINDAVYEQRKNELTDHDGDGFIFEDDCDDDNAAAFPGANELCNATDDDCNGAIDDEASDVTAWFEDADGDGHGTLATKVFGCDADPGFVALDDDCDDLAPGTYPGAADAWYDGVDSNCDLANDFDADGDGDDASEHGGTDCNDENELVAGTIAEGWYDGGIDNNCDGSIDDQAVAALDEVATRIDGQFENGAFGSTILALPPGWADDEAVVLAAEPYGGAGTVYGWRASSLNDSPAISNAEWTVTGQVDWDATGYGMGWAGNADNPLVAIARHGWDEGHGRVDVWSGGTLEGNAAFSIVGENAGTYFGVGVLSGHDHDGDGVHDVVVSAPTDSRGAANAGAVFVFLDAGGLSGEVGSEGADLVFYSTHGAAGLSAQPVGDIDGNGISDLGFKQDITFEQGPGGLIVTEAKSSGAYDAQSASGVQIHGGPFTFGWAWDYQSDGTASLFAASGGIYEFPLPLTGSITPWDNASQEIQFEAFAYSVATLRTDAGSFAGHTAFLATTPGYAGESGMVSLHRPYFSDGEQVTDAFHTAVGAAAGDLAGSGLDLLDWDDDGRLDLAIGAPGSDAAATGAGSMYLLLGPQ